ncbi:pentatricopeptide repeat-containing protein [Striga asiatica]|uniref:Pentatricopeptide repeat-containing protein n=1 Tax=Striga asiatica TaxID=4170 RepID=A0A5A7R425_STRAF|nr:pentatricopeptide repeat-containing protein [Striga asiatica]
MTAEEEKGKLKQRFVRQRNTVVVKPVFQNLRWRILTKAVTKSWVCHELTIVYPTSTLCKLALNGLGHTQEIFSLVSVSPWRSSRFDHGVKIMRALRFGGASPRPKSSVKPPVRPFEMHSRMTELFINQALRYTLDPRPICLYNLCRRLSCSNDGPSNIDVHEKVNESFKEGNQAVSENNEGHGQVLRKHEFVKKEVENVCRILESSPWGPSLEKALSSCVHTPQLDITIGVLRRMKDPDSALSYFRWVERETNQVNPPQTYNALLLLMARCKKIDKIENILEEMSLAGFSPSFETSTELISICVKARKLMDAYNILQSMRKFKIRPAFSAYTTLIGAFSSFHKPEYPDLMLSLFHQMQELGYEVNVHLFTTLIRVFARDARVDPALSLLAEMKSNLLEADIVLYNVCIDCFGKVGKVDMAWKFFHEIKSHGLRPDDVSYTSMISVLCRANRMDEAAELFEQMEVNREIPCAYAYSTMIMGYGSSGRFREAYGMLERQRMRGSIPNVIAYNSLLTCLGKKGKIEEALSIFDEMKKDAMPNLTTCNILVDMLCRTGKANKLDEARTIFNGLDRKTCGPNKFTYCSLIDGLGRHGRVDEAYKLYEDMLDSLEGAPDSIVYTSLIRSFFKVGRKEDGHKIYKEMARKGISPDLTLLNTYMDCVFKSGEIEKGRALFDEIKSRFRPDARSYSILIHGLIKAGLARETYELFYAMKESGCVLDTMAYNTVIDGFCKSGKVNKAYQLLEEMKAKGHQPTVVTYGSVIDGLAKIDRLDEAYMLFEEAKSIGVRLNVVVYSSLVDGFGKVGRIDEAYLIIEEMMQNNINPNIQTWNCLLDALVKAEEVDEALVCWNSMKDLKCTPNIVTYGILINGLCRVRKFNKAFVFWQEMQKQGLKPNAITYLTMISGLAKAGNIFEADKLFERFKANGGVPDSACYNTMIEGLSLANKASEAYRLFEETRRKGCSIYTKTCVVLLDALHKADCLEQAGVVGALKYGNCLLIEFNMKGFVELKAKMERVMIFRVHMLIGLDLTANAASEV